MVKLRNPNCISAPYTLNPKNEGFAAAVQRPAVAVGDEQRLQTSAYLQTRSPTLHPSTPKP